MTMADGDRHSTERPRRNSRDRPSVTMTATRAAGKAARAVYELTGREPESIVSVEHGEDGWRVGVEVVEAHRIPDSADILAVYEAQVDGAGHLLAYRRTSRYPRGRTEGV